jgi:hypothetical protein
MLRDILPDTISKGLPDICHVCIYGSLNVIKMGSKGLSLGTEPCSASRLAIASAKEHFIIRKIISVELTVLDH